MDDDHQDKSRFELTASQHSMLLGQLLQANDPLYNMVMCFDISAAINVEAFKKSFQLLIESSDILRTVIVYDANKQHTAYQLVKEHVAYSMEIEDFSSQADPTLAYRQWLAQRKLKLFDLTEELFDSVLIKLSSTNFIWYFNQHHLCTDAWSMSLLYDKMQSIYPQVLQRRDSTAAIEALPDFQQSAIDETRKKSSKRYIRAIKFWQKNKNIPFLATQFYNPTKRNRSAKTNRVNCQFGRHRSELLRSLANNNFASLSEDMSVMQIFVTLLFSYMHRISGNNILSIGTPVHSRTSEQLKKTAGPLINVFPLSINMVENETFSSLYDKVAKANQHLLINAVPGMSNQVLSRKFDTVVNYIPSHFGSFAGYPTNTEWVHPDHGDRDHLLRLQIYDFQQSGEFTLCFDLNDDVFNEIETDWVCKHFLALTDAFLEDYNRQIVSIPLVNSQTLPYQNLDTSPANLNFQSIVESIARQTIQTPNNQALIDGSQSLSYQQLDLQSSQFAMQLQQFGITSGDVVAIKLERSIEAVIAILGVLKCSATFLPIDSAHPLERIKFMLNDSAAKCVVVESQNAANNPFLQPVVVVNRSNEQATFDLPTIQPLDIAYIIYTSGSTGQPKGVLVPHKGLSNYIQWASSYYLAGQKLDFPLFTSLSFDLTITSMFVPLCVGSKLIIYADAQSEAGLLIRSVVEDNQVDVIKLTPAHLTLIQSMDFSTSRLKKLIVGGDDFKTELALTLSRFFAGQIDIFNEYGPTEATVACTVHKFNAELDTSNSVPIGKPIQFANIYILDPQMHQVPQGVSGEIYIGGVGVTSGYLNQPEMTKTRFIQSPFNADDVLYRTGDLASFNRKGEIEYLGREDQQIKIQGVRIETAEIESTLLKFDGITDAVVDVSEHLSLEAPSENAQHCVTCGLEASHPSAQLDQSHTCRICRIYQKQQKEALGYFRDKNDLSNWIAKIKQQAMQNSNCKQDAIMLLSGGKDSSYALCKLVDMGLTPLVFTLDNGFISEGAKANCKRLVDRLGLELIEGSTPDMNDIFVDSLTRFSNVCNGCFKTIYTLSMKIAKEKGIKIICTGLSRGQIFETRVAHLFQQGCFESNEIDKRIIDARKAYHRTKDIISNRLDVRVFEDDEIFEEIQYLDFYRYVDVTLDEMYDYLNNVAPWIRPSDTGRSTNCLINDAGIYVHKRERGYHNYSLPYSWDVRLGHKQRDAALQELDDEIDLVKVEKILQDIGYQSEEIKLEQNRQTTLIGYYVAPAEILKNTLQKHLAKTLPKEYIPTQFVWMSAIPLTKNGKVDRDALPQPRLSRRELSVDYSPPRTKIETEIARLWQQILGVEEVGIDDDFFDLGGDSIVNIQIVAAARNKGIEITPQQIFDYPSIRQLGSVAGETIKTLAVQTEVVGLTPLLPIQLRYLNAGPVSLNKFNQSVILTYEGNLAKADLSKVFAALIQHHDVLRSAFKLTENGWQQTILASDSIGECKGFEKDLSAFSKQSLEDEVEKCKNQLIEQLNIEESTLLTFANVITAEGSKNQLLIVIHHLVCDGVSWWILLSDLNALICASEQQKAKLAEKTYSVKQWADALSAFAQKQSTNQELGYWQKIDQVEVQAFNQVASDKPNYLFQPQELIVQIDQQQTKKLLIELPKRMSVPIQDVLLTAFAHTILGFTNAKSFKVDIEGHGREDLGENINTLRTIGWFTSIYPLLITSESLSLSGKDLKVVKEWLKQVPNHGVGYAVLGLNKPSEFLFNYMGQWDKNLSQDSRFSFAQPIAKSHDQTASTYAIELNAMVFNDCLQLVLSVNNGIFDEFKSDNIKAALTNNLLALIDYGVSGQELGFTPSDFPTANIAQSDLDDIFDEFGEDE